MQFLYRIESSIRTRDPNVLDGDADVDRILQIHFLETFVVGDVTNLWRRFDALELWRDVCVGAAVAKVVKAIINIYDQCPSTASLFYQLMAFIDPANSMQVSIMQSDDRITK